MFKRQTYKQKSRCYSVIGILAFLQILQILGRWTIAIIRNFHFVSAIILFINIVDRIVGNLFRTPSFEEIGVVLHLVVWNKLRKKKQSDVDPKTTINIENQNTVNITNDNRGPLVQPKLG